MCGANALCQVVNHNPICSCPPGYNGDPFNYCQKIPGRTILSNLINTNDLASLICMTLIETTPTPQTPPQEDQSHHQCHYPLKHCGPNSVLVNCTCQCIPDYTGNPELGCRPGCLLNSHCPTQQACHNSQCTDPCPGVCGTNAICMISHHSPICLCKKGFLGNPYEECTPYDHSKQLYRYRGCSTS